MADIWMTNDPDYLINKGYVKDAKYYSFHSGYFYQGIPKSITIYEHIGSEVVTKTIHNEDQIKEILQIECLHHDSQDIPIHTNYLVRVRIGPDKRVLDGGNVTKYLKLVNLTVEDLRQGSKPREGKISTTVKTCEIVDASTGNTVATGSVGDGRFHQIAPDIIKPVVVAEGTDGSKVIMQHDASMFSKENMLLNNILPVDAGNVMWEVLNITICEGSITIENLGKATDIVTDITEKYTNISKVLGKTGTCLTIVKPIIDVAVEKDNNKKLIIGSIGAASIIFSLAVSATPWGLLGKIIGTLVVDVVFSCLSGLSGYAYDKTHINQVTVRDEE